MAVTLNTVGDIVGAARTLLMDTEVGNYRWPDDDFYQALNEGLFETKKLRPDFFRGLTATPQYTAGDVNTAINYPEEYRVALINYIAGKIQLQDDEATDDERASKFLQSFVGKLTVAQA